VGSRAGCRTPGGVSPEWSRGVESPPLICWLPIPNWDSGPRRTRHLESEPILGVLWPWLHGQSWHKQSLLSLSSTDCSHPTLPSQLRFLLLIFPCGKGMAVHYCTEIFRRNLLSLASMVNQPYNSKGEYLFLLNFDLIDPCPFASLNTS